MAGRTMAGSPEMPTSLAVSMRAMRKPPTLSMRPSGKRLLAGPDLAGGEGLDFVVGGVAAGGDVVDELAVHVIDEGLEVGLLLRG